MKKIIAAVAVFAVMAGSAYASEWNFYGSARVQTFWSDTDPIDGPDTSDTTYGESLQSNARIGAKVKVSDELSGRFEYGAKNGAANIRHLYGRWDFGAGKLTVGQTYGPLNIAYSNQAFDDDMALGGYGDADMSRDPMVMLTFGGFKIAAITPSEKFDDNTGTASTEVTMPLIAASYTFDFNTGSFVIAGAYNSFEVDKEDVDSYVIAAGAEASFGLFSMAASVHTGENSGNMISVETGGNDGLATFTGTEVLDNEVMGYNLVIGMKINDMFGLEAGYGYIEEKLDGSDDNEACSYYIQAPIKLAPGVKIVPEIGKIDQKESGEDEMTYFGAKWQINF